MATDVEATGAVWTLGETAHQALQRVLAGRWLGRPGAAAKDDHAEQLIAGERPAAAGSAAGVEAHAPDSFESRDKLGVERARLVLVEGDGQQNAVRAHHLRLHSGAALHRQAYHKPGNVNVRLSAALLTRTNVRVTATFGLRDWSGSWDDRYKGQIFFAVVGE